MTTMTTVTAIAEAATMTAQIYVACLASYNVGKRHGAWVHVESRANMTKAIDAILATSPMPDATRWRIHGTKGFGEFVISQVANITDVMECWAFIESVGVALGSALLVYTGGSVSEAKILYQLGYMGKHASRTAFAEHTMIQARFIAPAFLDKYLNYETMAHDLFANEYIGLEVDGFTHVFLRHPPLF